MPADEGETRPPDVAVDAGRAVPGAPMLEVGSYRRRRGSAMPPSPLAWCCSLSITIVVRKRTRPGMEHHGTHVVDPRHRRYAAGDAIMTPGRGLGRCCCRQIADRRGDLDDAVVVALHRRRTRRRTDSTTRGGCRTSPSAERSPSMTFSPAPLTVVVRPTEILPTRTRIGSLRPRVGDRVATCACVASTDERLDSEPAHHH